MNQQSPSLHSYQNDRTMKNLLQVFVMLGCIGTLLTSCGPQQEKTYHDNGKIHETYTVDKEGQRHGTFKRYSIDGALYEIANYDHGKLQGERQIYYPDGQVEITEQYDADQLNGPYKRFHPNGNLMFEATYSNNVIQQQTKAYFENGALKEEVTFDGNMENGPFTEYYLNGQVHWKGNYKNGDNEVGLLEEYDESGTLIKKMMCDDRSICRTIWTIHQGDVDPNATDNG